MKLLDRLVAFDTTSARSNLALIVFIEAYLAEQGVTSRRVASDDGTKTNLYAVIGPSVDGGVMLSGHTDVVSIDGQDWRFAPFALHDDGERLYGRGTADMKGFLAAVLAAVPEMVAADLRVPIHLAFSYDEEVGCLGVRRLIDMMAAQAHRPTACIVGEPSGMQVATAHKGKQAMRVHVQGRACHSGMAPRGVNAIHAAARLIGWVADTAAERAAHGPFDARFGIAHTTLQAGCIRGGAALNIVPEHCTFDVEIRHVPADDIDTLVAAFETQAAALTQTMQASDPQAGIRIEPLGAYPGLSIADDDALVRCITALLEAATITRIDYGTEAGLFQRDLDLPSLVCGPGHMAQGHQPDEFTTHAQLMRCSRFLDRLIETLSADRETSGMAVRERLGENRD
ncbi:acetylornithine deacetylase [Salinisphaera sp. Q1T1-3]|uniref:acetylornithine deacetylase n=1 Tax=Salinisphaera sp. Q1T1-3 TaxID=2321229 RepID=UPI0018F3FC3A|nr:acetylornithine deacetylase [Salinisphaera sp. Q1T1-3]